VLDGYLDNVDVASAKREIELMAGVFNESAEPPTLVLDGYGAIEHDATEDPTLKWVIVEPPEWGEKIRSEDGTLLRQAFTITFALYTTDQELRRPGIPPLSSESVHAKLGDTFETIAARCLHHAHWGGLLAKFNERTSAAARLSAGQLVFLPNQKQRSEWARSGSAHR
jgi:hypothetical protein